MSAALKQAAQLAQALRALANAAGLHIDEAGCDCPFRMRERGEHLAGCSHFDLSIEINSAFVTLAAIEAEPQQEPDKLDAERYRDLRDGKCRNWAICEWGEDQYYADLRGHQIVDAAIDAARKAQP